MIFVRIFYEEEFLYFVLGWISPAFSPNYYFFYTYEPTANLPDHHGALLLENAIIALGLNEIFWPARQRS